MNGATFKRQLFDALESAAEDCSPCAPMRPAPDMSGFWIRQVGQVCSPSTQAVEPLVSLLENSLGYRGLSGKNSKRAKSTEGELHKGQAQEDQKSLADPSFSLCCRFRCELLS